MKEGWICPRCKTVNAPHIDRCDCRGTQSFSHGRGPVAPKPPVRGVTLDANERAALKAARRAAGKEND